MKNGQLYLKLEMKKILNLLKISSEDTMSFIQSKISDIYI